MKLRSGENFVVSIVRFSSFQSLCKSCDKPRTGSASIPGEDNARLDIWFDAEVPDEFAVDLDQGFIRRGIG